MVRAVADWLLEGDPSIRWQVFRDLLGRAPRTVDAERRRTAREGWGARLLALQESSGGWGGGLYNPKWTSTTYTLLLARDLGLPEGHPRILDGCRLLLDERLRPDGGLDFSRPRRASEPCITGMILSTAAFFRLPGARLDSLAAHLLGRQMPDGGWNCQDERGATHSSFHTTILALEGLFDYEQAGGAHAAAARAAQAAGREFLLRHQLFRSHRTGAIVHPAMTRFAFPPRWHYDVLRGLEYFRAANAPDPRLGAAIALVHKRRGKDGRWPLQNRYPGRTHFEMETPGEPSRWNTLRALRVLKWWDAASPG